MQMFDMDLNYDTAFHYHCLKNCIRQVLDSYQVKDAYLYVDVSCSFMFRLEDKGYASEVSTPYNNIWKPYQSYLRIEKYYEDETAEQSVCNFLQQGVPVIVAVDSFYQPYRSSYLKHHGSHAMILTKVQEDDFQVIDWYEPFFFKGFIRKDILRKARASKNIGSQNPFSGQEINRMTYVIQDFKECNDQRQLFFYGLQQIYDSFYKQRYSYTNKRMFYGVSALEQLMRFMEQNLNQVQQAKEISSQLHEDFFLLSIARKLQLYYIDTYQEYELPKEQLMQSIKKLVDLYDKIMFHLLKLGIRWSEAQLEQVLTLVQEVICVEKDTGNMMKVLIDTVGGTKSEI